MSEFNVEARAAAGAKLLDEKQPGWAKLIHQNSLDMESWTECMLGQIFGHYEDGFSELDLDDNKAVEYGFFPSDISTKNDSKETILLTVAFHKEIEARLVA